MGADDGLGFTKNWGRTSQEDYVLRVFFSPFLEVGFAV